MALELQRFVSDEHACEYLPDARAVLEYRLLVRLGPGELDDLLARGWRRFGPVVFRPACPACNECVSLRIKVADFTPSRSQRRARNRCAHLRVHAGPPCVDRERLALYARWHAAREHRRGWDPAPLGAEEYARNFGFADASAREVTYRDGDHLVGVGICDETPTAWSAVYFFHDPAYTRLSPGVNHVLSLVERARQQGKPHVYLGYRVLGCFSMRYKASFHPHELLLGRPDEHHPPHWRPGERTQPDQHDEEG